MNNNEREEIPRKNRGEERKKNSNRKEQNITDVVSKDEAKGRRKRVRSTCAVCYMCDSFLYQGKREPLRGLIALIGIYGLRTSYACHVTYDVYKLSHSLDDKGTKIFLAKRYDKHV